MLANGLTHISVEQNRENRNRTTKQMMMKQLNTTDKINNLDLNLTSLTTCLHLNMDHGLKH